MAILVQDSFDRANSTTGLGTSSSGHVWSALSGVFGISTNQAYWVSGTALSVLESGQSDVTITADMINSGVPGITFRLTDSSNYWLFRNLNNTYNLYKFVGGSATLVGSKSGTISDGVTYAWKIILNGSLIECYVDNVLILSTTDTHSQSATKHGLRQHDTGINNNRYDNFIVESLATGNTYTASVGGASVTPSSILDTAISIAQIVGNATMTPSGTLSKTVTFALFAGGAILSPVGTIIKRIGKGVGNAVITPIGSAVKGLGATVGGAILSIIGSLTPGLNVPIPTSFRLRINQAFQSLKNFFD